MSQARPASDQDGRRDRVADMRAANRDLVVLGAVSAQNDSGTIRPAWPQPWARRAGVEHSTDVVPVVQPATGAIVMLPPGVDLEDVLAELVDR